MVAILEGYILIVVDIECDIKGAVVVVDADELGVGVDDGGTCCDIGVDVLVVVVFEVGSKIRIEYMMSASKSIRCFCRTFSLVSSIQCHFVASKLLFNQFRIIADSSTRNSCLNNNRLGRLK